MPSQCTLILLEFQPHVLRMLLHKEASSVIADAFELYANAYERTILLRELCHCLLSPVEAKRIRSSQRKGLVVFWRVRILKGDDEFLDQ